MQLILEVDFIIGKIFIYFNLYFYFKLQNYIYNELILFIVVDIKEVVFVREYTYNGYKN